MNAIGILAHPHKELFKERFPQILEFLESFDFEIYCSRNICPSPVKSLKQLHLIDDFEIPNHAEMILSFGGDGTMLRSMQLIAHREVPVLGINVGGLGFLTEVSLEEFIPVFRNVMEGKFRVENRNMLEGKIIGKNEPFWALNEVTIEKGRSTRVIEAQVVIDGVYFSDIVADGLIISTPTGSTGYSLSSGGPIVVPTSECFILNPICPHSLTNRPVIVPANSNISIQIFTDFPEVVLSADNQDVREIPSRTKIELKRADFSARLVKHLDSDYYSVLRNKLNWGSDFRDKLRWSFNR